LRLRRSKPNLDKSERSYTSRNPFGPQLMAIAFLCYWAA
jgi:hypothetical protein